jgi:hypothetical protein
MVVAESETLDALGPQDILIASNFLCHMYPSMAERCLRNIARLVRPHVKNRKREICTGISLFLGLT